MMSIPMGRKREHDERTGQALLAAAEQLVAEGGLGALSVRAVAQRVDTTTRAVYSLFGSKAGLEQALVARSFQLLAEEVGKIPFTETPADDLVTVVVQGFRGFVRAHPDLFRLVFTPSDRPQPAEAAEAERISSWDILLMRIARVKEAGLSGEHGVGDIACGVHALAVGLGILELCQMLPPRQAERMWTDAMTAYVAGLAVGPTTGQSNREGTTLGKPRRRV
jgi:AcrR family transcriptional regulator